MRLMEINCPDCYKNGRVKKKVIGSIKLPNGKVTIETCYRNGNVSYDISDFSFNYKSTDCLIQSRLFSGLSIVENDGVKTYDWQVNNELALDMNKYFEMQRKSIMSFFENIEA